MLVPYRHGSTTLFTDLTPETQATRLDAVSLSISYLSASLEPGLMQRRGNMVSGCTSCNWMRSNDKHLLASRTLDRMYYHMGRPYSTSTSTLVYSTRFCFPPSLTVYRSANGCCCRRI